MGNAGITGEVERCVCGDDKSKMLSSLWGIFTFEMSNDPLLYPCSCSIFAFCCFCLEGIGFRSSNGFVSSYLFCTLKDLIEASKVEVSLLLVFDTCDLVIADDGYPTSIVFEEADDGVPDLLLN